MSNVQEKRLSETFCRRAEPTGGDRVRLVSLERLPGGRLDKQHWGTLPATEEGLSREFLEVGALPVPYENGFIPEVPAQAIKDRPVVEPRFTGLTAEAA